MKKQIFRLMMGAAVALVAVGCNSNKYTIVGSLEVPGDEYRYDSVSLTLGDQRTAVAIVDDAFELSGEVSVPTYATLFCSLVDAQTGVLVDDVPIFVVVEPGQITIKCDDEMSVELGGTPQNEAMMALVDECLAWEEDIESEWEDIKVILSDYILANKDKQAALFGFAIGRSFLNSEEMVALAEQCSEEIQADENIATLLRLRVGQPFADFEIETAEGSIKLSDYVGKGNLVLVDFWASWCMPCRASIPTVKAVYDEFKDKGLVVVGVPTSDFPEDTREAVEEDGIEFPQMIGIERQAIGAKTYGVTGIPHMVLFAPDGTILARGLNGDNLREAILEHIK